jgi:hypothetical protein
MVSLDVRSRVRRLLRYDYRLDRAEHTTRRQAEVIRKLEDDLHRAEAELARKDTAIHRLLAHLIDHDRHCGAWPSSYLTDPGRRSFERRT